MRDTTLTVILCINFILTACTGKTDCSRLLTETDLLMHTHPDSSLHILKKIPVENLKTDENKAYYALLMTQAKDKNYIVQTDDSLIRTAVQYYDAKNNIKMQSRAYYLWGSVFRDKNKQAAAVEKYLIAIPFALKTNDKKLAGRIYNNLGYLYYRQDLNEKADSIYQLTKQIGVELKDTNLWAESLAQQGKIKYEQKLYPQAENKLLQALDLLENSKEKAIRANISATLSSLYNKSKNREKAIWYAKQNIALQRDTLRCYRAFLLLGDAYFHAEQHDSAIIYFNKSLHSPRYGTKAGTYMRLADIARKQNDISLSLNMERLYSTYMDSLNRSSQSNSILETEKHVLIQQQQEQHEGIQNKYHYYIIILILMSILLLYKLRTSYLKKLRRQQKEHFQMENDLNQQHTLLTEELNQKEKQIAILQGEINQYHVDEEHKQILQNECETLKKQRESLIKEALKHSDVYAKIERILLNYKETEYSQESLNEEDWLKLTAEIDKNSVISDMGIQYDFTEKEMHLCYLLLLDFSLSDRARLMQVSRRTPYRAEKEILRKIGETYSARKLQKFLKDMIN